MMRGVNMGLAALASVFAGLNASLERGNGAIRDLGSALRAQQPRHGKPGDRIARRAAYAEKHAPPPAGTKLAKKAGQGRLGMTQPTRGTMATPTRARPFSTRGLPPLSAPFPKPPSIRQWKRRLHAEGKRSVPFCNVVQ